MAIDLTLKSVGITNRQATPPVLNNVGAGGPGDSKEIYDYLASVPASLSVTSIIRIVQVPSNCRVTSVRLFSGAQTAGAFDIGVYRTNNDGGAVVDADLFGSAVSVASAVDGVEQAGESGNYTLANRTKPLWQAAGLSADPGGYLDIALTCATTAVTTGAQPIGLSVRYVA